MSREAPDEASAVEVYLNDPDGCGIPTPLIRRALLLLLREEGVREGEIAVTFLPDEPMRELNRRWLGHDRVPDVLAFSLHEEGEEAPIGDVYVGVEQGERQAREHGTSRDEELARLALHGTLHVLGYEHPEGAAGREASPQYRRQEEILARALTEEGP